MDLRPYQQEAVDSIVTALSKSGKGTVAMACGTGKTFVGLRSASEILENGDLLTIMVPSLTLMQQWYSNVTAVLPDAEVLGLCSDEELRDDESETRADTTTDSERVKEFIATSRGVIRVVLCTYHSSPILGNAALDLGIKIDMVICDEAHRTAGAHEAVFTTVLFDTRFPAIRRLFLSATPRLRLADRTADGQKMMSMSDPLYYGDRLYTYTFGQAIEEGYLSDYQIVVMVVSDSSVHQKIIDNKGFTVDGQAFNAKSLASCLSIHKVREQYSPDSVLVFHNTISASRGFTTNMKTLGWVSDFAPPSIYHLDGITPHSARNEALRALAEPSSDSWTVVSNVRLLTEGIDVPSIDTVMFAEPKSSQIDVVQAIGRALRLSPKGTKSQIVIPVYLAPGENPDAMLSGSDYRHVWQVVNAIRDHDRSLDQELDQIRRNDYDPTRPAYEPSVMPERIVVSGFNEDLERFQEAITTLVLDNLTSSWSTGLDRFAEYLAETGNPDVPTRYLSPSDSFPLGRWVQAQRQSYRWDRLTEDQYDNLMEAGFSWGSRSKQWRTMVERINRYRDLSRDEFLPAPTTIGYDPELYHWILKQSERAEKGNLSKMESQELSSMLTSWTKRSMDVGYEPAIQVLRRFAQKRRAGHGKGRNGKRPIGGSITPEVSIALGTVSKFPALVSPQDLEMLNSSGFTLPEAIQIVPGEEGWEEKFLEQSITNQNEQTGTGTLFLSRAETMRLMTRQKKAKSRGEQPTLIDPAPSNRPLTLNEVFPMGDYIAVSDQMNTVHGREMLYWISDMVNEAEGVESGKMTYMVDTSFRVWKVGESSPDEPQVAGQVKHHLDDIVVAIDPIERAFTWDEIVRDCGTSIDLSPVPEDKREEFQELVTAQLVLTSIEIYTETMKSISGHQVRISTPMKGESADEKIRKLRANKRAVVEIPDWLSAEMNNAMTSRLSAILVRIVALLMKRRGGGVLSGS